MTKDWAREKVEKVLGPLDHDDSGSWKHDNQVREAHIELLRAERARARRVVRTLKKKLNARQFNYDISYGYKVACDELLLRLQ